MIFSSTVLGFYAFFFIYLIHVSTIYAIPLYKRTLEEPTESTDPKLEPGKVTDIEEQQSSGILPGMAVILGGALQHGNGFPSEVGKAITESMKDSASAEDGGAASTIVNLPSTGYTVLKAVDSDPGIIGSTSHTLFGGKAKSNARAA